MGPVLNLRKTLSNWVSKTLADDPYYLQSHKTKGKTNFEETRQLFRKTTSSPSALTTGLQSSTIATFSVGTTEKTIMAEKTTEELVKMVNDWAVQRIEDMVKSSGPLNVRFKTLLLLPMNSKNGLKMMGHSTLRSCLWRGMTPK